MTITKNTSLASALHECLRRMEAGSGGDGFDEIDREEITKATDHLQKVPLITSSSDLSIANLQRLEEWANEMVDLMLEVLYVCEDLLTETEKLVLKDI